MTASRSGPTGPVVVDGVADVVAAVERAHRLGLRPVVRTRGDVASTDDVLVVDLSRISAVGIDVDAGVASVGGGASWSAVLAAAHPHGLAPVPGDGIDGSVVGTLLSGDPGWLARAHGLSRHTLRTAQVVTDTGSVEEATGVDLPTGIVTAVTLDLVSVAELYAGAIRYPASMAPEVGARFAEWTADLPPAMTSALVLGGSHVVVRVCHVGPADEGRDLIGAWRRWATPLADHVTLRSPTELGVLDDPQPRPALTVTESLRALSDPAVHALGAAVWGSPVALRAEVRHLAGVIRPGPEPTDLLLRVCGSAGTPDMTAAVARRQADLRRALVAVGAIVR